MASKPPSSETEEYLSHFPRKGIRLRLSLGVSSAGVPVPNVPEVGIAVLIGHALLILRNDKALNKYP